MIQFGSRQLFLLLVGIILLVSAEIGVHEGDLKPLTCFNAIMSMTGDSSHKSIWWQFLPYLSSSSSHAFLAYMVSSFNGTSLEREIYEKGGLFSTRPASIIEHQSKASIPKLGDITITLWALGYVCLDIETTGACTKLTPVVLQKVPAGLNKSAYAFFSLWEEHDGEVSNTVTSKILELPNWNLERASPESKMTLRSMSERLPMCPGLELIVNGSQTSTAATREVRIGEIKTAPETAGFKLYNRTDSVTRLNRSVCLMGVDNSSSSNLLDTTTTSVDILGSFVSHVRDQYIQAHSAALNLKHPDVDFWSAAITLPSAYLAVLTAAVPLVNFQLKFFRGGLETSHRMKMFLLCLCNGILAVASYSAVIAVIPSEMTRQEEFRTWGLLADKVPITTRGLNVLVVAQAESKYTSGSLILVLVSIALLVPIVVALTIYRSNQVLHRGKLLKSLRALEAAGNVNVQNPPSSRLDPGEEQILDRLRAIEMSSSEEHKLTSRLMKLRIMCKRRTMQRVQSIP